MFVIYEDREEMQLLHLPGTEKWSLCASGVDDGGYDEAALYLRFRDEKQLILHEDRWFRKVPGLPRDEVKALYRDILEAAVRQVAEDPAAVLDIRAMEAKLMEEKYRALWTEKGYTVP